MGYDPERVARGLPARSEVIRCLAEEGRALHAREVATRLGVREAAYPELLALLDRLCLEGTVRRQAGNRYRAEAQPEPETWEGALTVHPRGFGFVAAPGRDDVYVAADGLAGALHGDRVQVVVVARSVRGAEGRIEQIVERRPPRVAGVLRSRGRSTWLEPDDSRLRGPIVVTSGEARGQDGQAAVVMITRFPEHSDENPEAELVRVLGTPGDPGVELGKILEREGLSVAYPEQALVEARQAAARRVSVSAEGRADLTSLPMPTIDPEDARDHDDAIWVERLPEGYRVWVAIADVAEFVRPDTELDQEAARRGCSVYLPDRAIPMLPPELSAIECSLLPGDERLCLYVRAELDRKGKVQDCRIGPGRMRSQAALTYRELASTLGWSAQGGKSSVALSLRDGLLVADEVSRKLRRARLRRGALDLSLPEAEVVLGAEGSQPVDVRRREEDPGIRRAYQMVEEFMLLANQLVAEWLGERAAPTIYRVHAPPDPAKLERLCEVAKRLGAPCDQEVMLTPAGVSRWLSALAEHPRRPVLEMLLLRSLKQASYDIGNIGHFGLACSAYLHFTSPIRRYPDLMVHRAVKALLSGVRPDVSEAALTRLRLVASQSSLRERAAAEVEREAVDLYRGLLMRGRIGDRLEGSVSGIGPSGLYVTLDQPFVDVMVPFDALGEDTFDLGADERVVGRRSGETLELGDRMAVVIQDVSLVRRLVLGRRAREPMGARARERAQPKGSRRPKPPVTDRGESQHGPRRLGSSGGQRVSSSATRGRSKSGSIRERGSRDRTDGKARGRHR